MAKKRKRKATEKYGCLWWLLMVYIWPFYLAYLIIKEISKSVRNAKEEKAPAPAPSSVPERHGEVPVRTTDTRTALPVTPKTEFPPEIFVPVITYPGSDKDKEITRRKIAYDKKRVYKLDKYCIADVETTGFSQHDDRIVQIALLKVNGGEIEDEFTTLVNPERLIPARVIEIHGITNDDVKDAPKYSDIADQVRSFLDGEIVVGHNVTLDLRFLDVLLDSASARSEDDVLYVDTCTYARRVHEGLENYKLQTLLEYYEIDPGKAHRADSDAKATLELFKALQKEDAEQKKAEAAAKKKAAAERKAKLGKSPLFDASIVFLGDFASGRAAMQASAEAVGAAARQSVSGKTAYVVKGKPQSGLENYFDWNVEKAEELAAAGKPVRIISESEFLSLVSEARAALEQDEVLAEK